MHQLEFNKIRAQGDYRRRALLNFDRLEGEEYRPDAVFKPGDYDWPGEYEGRAILALSLLAQATGREPKYLREIISELPSHFNERGYLGRVLGKSQVDEQQLSGHSWLLRGLCEYFLWSKDEQVLGMARRIAENLFLPARDAYTTYPIKPEQRSAGGGESGNLTGDLHDGWYCSTDISCAFIGLDGVTHLYEITRDQRLKALIEAMIAKFLEIDLVGITAQTHATLTALRGILRFYECMRDEHPELVDHPELVEGLDGAKRIYNLYKTQAMTENYENFNWFARPEWTEPCAVIDSFIVAVSLWKHTGERAYLDDAHSILFNGMGYELRPNGGFGTNSCSGSKDEFLGVSCYEATWCCVMRGGEGLARAIQYLCFVDEGRILLPFCENCSLSVSAGGGEIVFDQSSEYPTGGKTVIQVRESSVTRPITLGLYVPPWANDMICMVNGDKAKSSMSGAFLITELIPKAGDCIELCFDVVLHSEVTMNPRSIPGHRTLRHGALILGARHLGNAIPLPDLESLDYLGDGKYLIAETDTVLTPINSLVDLSDEAARQDQVQILFGDK